MHDESIDRTIFAVILGDAAATAVVHHSSASVDELFKVTESLNPMTPNDIWSKYYLPPLERDGLTSEIDDEKNVIPESETLDSFLAVNQQSVSLAGLGFNIVDTKACKSKQDACSQIPNCTGWWRFSRIGYNHRKTEALVHTDYDDPQWALMGMGHFVLLHRESGLWHVAGTHITWVS